MSIKTNISIVFSMGLALGIMVVFSATTQAASYCLNVDSGSFGGDGKPATFTISNNKAFHCGPKTVSMCSYRVYIMKPKPGWSTTQTLFDHKTIVLQEGETKTITINTDICTNQVDAFEGECPDLSKENGNLITGQINASMHLCTAAKCVDECSPEGKRECAGKGWKICRKAADGCLKWSPVTDCETDKKCDNGTCVKSCTDECSPFGKRECVGNGWKQCGNFDSDSCNEWGPVHDCESFTTCSSGSCNNNQLTVDLRSSGSVTCNKNATLTWTSTNASSCSASGGWSGTKAISGSETAGNFTGSKTFTLTCSNSNSSASDSVTLNGSFDELNVNAGSDMEVNAGKSIELSGSVSGSGTGGSPIISWSCTGGTLSNRASLTPTFRTDSDETNRTFTCTVTATNECGSNSDSMKVRVNKKEVSDFDVTLTTRPKEDCAPLNDVDLTAKVTNFGDNDKDYTYYFDCDNDGDWEKTATTNNTSYTASNLCDYRNVGTYTAKVKVVSNGRNATDTAIVRVEECKREETREVGNVSIFKTVRNVTGGTGYSGTVAANPGDALSYKIVITGISRQSNNVRVSDAMPNGIISAGNLQVDGYSQGYSLASGINLGNIAQGQTKTITYTANAAGEYSFGYGQTTLTNTATVTTDGGSTSANAAVTVYCRAVQGATTVSTGFDGNMFAGLAAALIGLAACAGWLLKDQILNFFKKDSAKALNKKIAFVKEHGLAR